jgi:hypothetical protein
MLPVNRHEDVGNQPDRGEPLVEQRLSLRSL